MWNASLPDGLLRQAIKRLVSETPVSFAQLVRMLPQLKGTEDLELKAGLILWRGLCGPALAALRGLHAEASIFFWLCPPSVYLKTDDAPFLRLMSRAHRPGEQAWLPTLIFNRPPSAAESRQAVSAYVAELARKPLAAL